MEPPPAGLFWDAGCHRGIGPNGARSDQFPESKSFLKFRQPHATRLHMGGCCNDSLNPSYSTRAFGWWSQAVGATPATSDAVRNWASVVAGDSQSRDSRGRSLSSAATWSRASWG